MQGIIIINKPQGFTSQDVVSKVKKILNIKKAGHTGTLDPLATGVLPVLLGNYTKLSKYLIEHDKTYIAKIKLGERRVTGDKEGEVIETKPVNKEMLLKENVESVLGTFLGKQMQIPPIYSAIKVDGKKLYEYARQGIEVKIEPREIEVYKLDLLNINSEEKEIEISVSCSKGTYIRVLCEDIAKMLDTVGYMSYLNRIIVDKFRIENAIDFETLEKNKDNEEFLKSNIITMENVFKEFPKLNLNSRKLELFLNGVMLTFKNEDGIYNIYDENNKYIGTGTIKNELLKRDIII
ncbi:MAG: tRNA pseudouridine(55) synthase TruB [Clostridia bacterium]|nr:tRNA pseudouridine(55) synthase TruB [Clostridia bacterium]